MPRRTNKIPNKRTGSQITPTQSPNQTPSKVPLRKNRKRKNQESDDESVHISLQNKFSKLSLSPKGTPNGKKSTSRGASTNNTPSKNTRKSKRQAKNEETAFDIEDEGPERKLRNKSKTVNTRASRSPSENVTPSKSKKASIMKNETKNTKKNSQKAEETTQTMNSTPDFGVTKVAKKRGRPKKIKQETSDSGNADSISFGSSSNEEIKESVDLEKTKVSSRSRRGLKQKTQLAVLDDENSNQFPTDKLRQAAADAVNKGNNNKAGQEEQNVGEQQEEAPKKRRGRPPSVKKSEIIQDSKFSSFNVTPRKSRGRKKKSTPNREKSGESLPSPKLISSDEDDDYNDEDVKKEITEPPKKQKRAYKKRNKDTGKDSIASKAGQSQVTDSQDTNQQDSQQENPPSAKKKRGRPPKVRPEGEQENEKSKSRKTNKSKAKDAQESNTSEGDDESKATPMDKEAKPKKERKERTPRKEKTPKKSKKADGNGEGDGEMVDEQKLQGSEPPKPKRKYRKKEKDMPKMKRSGKFSAAKTKKIFDDTIFEGSDVKRALDLDGAASSDSEYNSEDGGEMAAEDNKKVFVKSSGGFSSGLHLLNGSSGNSLKNTPHKLIRPIHLNDDPKLNGLLNKFDEAIQQLQEYTIPDEIPCRESEKEVVSKFIEEGVTNHGLSHCLYISGVPGIGKTISCVEVIKEIKRNLKVKKIDDFNFIHINGLNMVNPENAYQTLLNDIASISNVSNQTACLLLNSIFSKGSLPKSYRQYNEGLDPRTRLVLLDELDYLITKDQNLLYNIFDWAQNKNSKLVVIGIANTMNLKDQLLAKIQSRMGDRTLVYKPYTSKQIEQILSNRLQKMDIISPDSLIFLSKKIATFSSDIRRTLHVCREALKICREEVEKTNIHSEDFQDTHLLQIQHIRESYALIYSNPYHQQISMLLDNAKIALLAIGIEMQMKGQFHANLLETHDRMKSMLNNLGRKIIKFSETKAIMKQLIGMGILSEKPKPIMKKELNNKEGTQGAKIDINANNGGGNIKAKLNLYPYTNVSDSQLILKITVDDLTNSLKEDSFLSKFMDMI